MSATKLLKEQAHALLKDLADLGTDAKLLDRLERLFGEMRQHNSTLQQQATDWQAAHEHLQQKIRQLIEQLGNALPQLDAAEQRRKQAEARFQLEHAAYQSLRHEHQRLTKEHLHCRNRLQAAERRWHDGRQRQRQTVATTPSADSAATEITPLCYDPHTIRDFLNHLVASLHLRIHEHSHPGEANEALAGGVRPFQVKYHTTALLKGLAANLGAQGSPDKLRMLHDALGSQRAKQLDSLLAAHAILEEALECADHPDEELHDYWRYDKVDPDAG